MYSDDLFSCEEEAIDCFRNSSLISKEDILERIKEIKNRALREVCEKKSHGPVFYETLNQLVDRFEEAIEKAVLFDAPAGWWSYFIDIETTGMKLVLQHFWDVDFDEEAYVTATFVDQEFEMITVPARVLTVDEYSVLYGVEQVTVRQWIRRGKIRDAMKMGGEWRISELSEVPSQGYRFGQYRTAEVLHDVPEEYAFLKPNQVISLRQDENVKSIFSISLDVKDEDEVEIEMDTKSREKFELFLISHPEVTCVSTNILSLG